MISTMAIKPLNVRSHGASGTAERMILLALLVIVVVSVFVLAGCSQLQTVSAGMHSPSPVQQSTGTACPAQPRNLNVVFDFTGSPVENSVLEAWKNTQANLPHLVETFDINCIRVWGFYGDGWNWTNTLDLPVMPPERPGDTELDRFDNIKQAKKLDGDKRRHQDISAALKPLSSLNLSSELHHSADSSNIVGLFRRISQDMEIGSLYIVITDLADTKVRTFPKIVPPPPGVQVLVLVVPSRSSDTIMTLGRDIPPDEQYEIRRKQFVQNNQWAVVTPYFLQNFSPSFAVPQAQAGNN
jgi:hypothetical protein